MTNYARNNVYPLTQVRKEGIIISGGTRIAQNINQYPILCRRDYLNSLKYSVEIDGIKVCGMIEAPKVMNMDKGFEFFRKSGII